MLLTLLRRLGLPRQITTAPAEITPWTKWLALYLSVGQLLGMVVGFSTFGLAWSWMLGEMGLILGLAVGWSAAAAAGFLAATATLFLWPLLIVALLVADRQGLI